MYCCSVSGHQQKQSRGYDRAMKNGMSLLLCSDGFRPEVSEQEIYEMLKTAATVDAQNMHDRLEQLIRLSMQRGERDNITAALIKAQ